MRNKEANLFLTKRSKMEFLSLEVIKINHLQISLNINYTISYGEFPKKPDS